MRVPLDPTGKEDYSGEDSVGGHTIEANRHAGWLSPGPPSRTSVVSIMRSTRRLLTGRPATDHAAVNSIVYGSRACNIHLSDHHARHLIRLGPAMHRRRGLHALRIDRDDAIEALLIRFFNRLRSMRNARVVERAVQAANVRTVFSSSAFTSAAWLTFILTNNVCAPSFFSNSTVSLAAVSFKSPITIFARCCANARAVARPMPVLPPVIRIVF